jgi:anti-repressor protein
MTELDLFAADGLDPSHFGLTDDGVPYVVASPFAKALGYRDAADAIRLLDGDEKGTQKVRTSQVSDGEPVVRRMSVIFEAGMWRLIFRSNQPSARSLTKRVTEILRQLRETGVVDTRPPLTELEMAERYVAALKRNAELEPRAQAWDDLGATGVTLDVAAAAQKLTASGCVTGQNRLYSYMRDLGWVYRNSTHPTQYAVERGYLEVDWGKTWTHPKTGEEQQGTAKSRVTPKGLDRLRLYMTGAA